MELVAGARAPVSILQAIALGFITAIVTGVFGMFLFSTAMVAKDPSELTDGPLLTNLGEYLGLLLFGSFFAIPFSLMISWLPTTVMGWALGQISRRYPSASRSWVYTAVGAIGGALVMASLDGFDPHGDWFFVGYGAACGIFAAQFFRYLTNKLPSA
ncbi:hypothetical protein [Altererythrobacter sp. Z27]|uniref:hypothetical protein n=1 Tax=Altererythrobacter sp. Z27 TaxID=3461147 RepID=UPI0040445822